MTQENDVLGASHGSQRNDSSTSATGNHLDLRERSLYLDPVSEILVRAKAGLKSESKHDPEAPVPTRLIFVLCFLILAFRRPCYLNGHSHY